MVTFTGDDVRALFTHSSHQHGLKLVATEKLFQCDGCKQIGEELRYRCEQCDFDLHVGCAQAPARIEPSMFEGRALTFFHSRPANANQPGGAIPICDVCGDPVCGFLYHNPEQDLDLHPLCANLPKRACELELHKATGHKCGVCGQDGYRGQYFSYRFQDDDGQLVYVHVVCFMEAHYSPTTSATLPRRAGGLKRLFKAAYFVARFSFSVANLGPVGIVTSVASPF